MIVLALDQSSSAIGWALGPPGGVPSFGTFAAPTSDDRNDYLPFLAGSHDWLHEKIIDAHVTHVRFEQPFLPRAGLKWVKKGPRSVPVPYVETNVQTLRKLYALAGVIELVAGERGADCTESNINSWRSWFLKGQKKPKGRKALKEAVIVRCTEFGWEPRNDNEGDALGIWAHACHLLTGYVPQRGPGELFKEGA